MTQTSKSPPLCRLKFIPHHFSQTFSNVCQKIAIFKAKTFRAIFKVVQTLGMYCSAIDKTLYANSAILKRRLKEERLSSGQIA